MMVLTTGEKGVGKCLATAAKDIRETIDPYDGSG